MFKKPEKTLEKDKDVTKSFLASGVELDAAYLKSVGSVVINGLYKGKLEVADTIEILSEGAVIGSISTNNASISGNIKGTIECSGFLELTQTANIEGDIIASSIEVEHGATINGMVKVNSKQINESGIALKCSDQLDIVNPPLQL